MLVSLLGRRGHLRRSSKLVALALSFIVVEAAAPVQSLTPAHASTVDTVTVAWGQTPVDAAATNATELFSLTAPCPIGTVTDFGQPSDFGCNANQFRVACTRADGNDGGFGTISGLKQAAKNTTLKVSFIAVCDAGEHVSDVIVSGAFSQTVDPGSLAYWQLGWPDTGLNYLNGGSGHISLTHLTWHADKFSAALIGSNTATPYSACYLYSCNWEVQGGRPASPGATPTVVAVLDHGAEDAGTNTFAVTSTGNIPHPAAGQIKFVRVTLTGAYGVSASAWQKVGDIIDGYDLDGIATSYLAGPVGYQTLCVLMSQIPSVNLLPTEISDPGKLCLTSEASGTSIQAMLALAVATFGAAVLIPIIADLGTPQHTLPDGTILPPTPPVPPNLATVAQVAADMDASAHGGLIGPQKVLIHDPSPISPHWLKVIARTCLQQVGAAALAGAKFGTANPCEDEPRLFPSGTSDPEVPKYLNAYAAAVHDLDTIAAHPELASLNYMSRAAKIASGVPNGWYNRAAYSAGNPCVGNTNATLQCDEYPLFASVQGGPVDRGGAGASLRLVDADQNKAEGTAYAQMPSTCQLQSATPNPASGQPGVGGTPFLVIPLVEVPLPSFFLCPNPTATPPDGGGGGGVS